jgi:hypothetical protein
VVPEAFNFPYWTDYQPTKNKSNGDQSNRNGGF